MVLTIRPAAEADHDAIWRIFHAVVAPAEPAVSSVPAGPAPSSSSSPPHEAATRATAPSNNDVRVMRRMVSSPL